MKKTILSLIAAFVTISAIAGNVSVSTAARMAESIFSTTRGGSVSLVWKGNDNGTRSSEATFYVFNYDRGGFVVISADDRAYPILAYSPTGSFVVENMPAHIKWFFDCYSNEIENVRSSSISQSSEMAARWEALKAPQSIKLLNTALWGQDAPFNNNCPLVDGKKAVSGCVATATSIIMYYHNWPLSQSGTLPSYSYYTDYNNHRTQEGHNLASSYNWSVMKNSYSSTSSSEANSAVATLLFDVGVMLQSSYNSADGKNTFGTAAYGVDIAPMLIKYMSYDSSAVEIFKNSMSSKEWSALMRSEIDADRPVAYGGSGDNGGHQFVLDGYGTDDYFHINWGWSGSDNGLYRLEALEPYKGTDFNQYQSAVVNIKPKEGNSPAELLKFNLNTSDRTGGLVYVSGTMAKGNTVKIAAQNITNNNFGSFSDAAVGSLRFKLAMCLCDKDDNIKEKYSESAYFDLDAGYYFSGDTISCKINSDLQLGDKFRLMYKTSGDWKPVDINYDWYNYDGTYNISDAVAVYDFPEIKVDSNGYSAGDMFDLRIINCQYIPIIIWYFDGVKISDGVNEVRLTSGKHTVKAEITCYKGSTIKSTKISTSTLIRVIDVN